MVCSSRALWSILHLKHLKSVVQIASLVFKNICIHVIGSFINSHTLLTYSVRAKKSVCVTEPCPHWLQGDNHFIISETTGKRKPRRGCLSQHQNCQCDESWKWTFSSDSSKLSKSNSLIAFWPQSVVVISTSILF